MGATQPHNDTSKCGRRNGATRPSLRYHGVTSIVGVRPSDGSDQAMAPKMPVPGTSPKIRAPKPFPTAEAHFRHPANADLLSCTMGLLMC